MKRNEFTAVQEFQAMRTALGHAVANSHPARQPEVLLQHKAAVRKQRASHVVQDVLAIADLALMPLLDITEAHTEQAALRTEQQAALPQRRTLGQIAMRTQQGEGTVVYPSWVR